MKINDDSTYACRAIIARKYNVAPVTIARINSESSGELLMRYMCQTMTRNADNSRSSPLSNSPRLRRQSERRNCIPNTVPIEFGITISWRLILTAHRLKKSIGIGGMFVIVGGSRMADTNGTAILASASAPKYTVSTLFFEVIAYTLGRNRFQRSGDVGRGSVP